MSLNEELKQLRTLRYDRDDAKDTFEDLDKKYRAKQAELMQQMEGLGVESMKIDGTNFVPTSTVYAQMQDRGEFVAWAKENAPELLEDRERKDLLNAEVRRCLDDGEKLPDGLGFYVREYISQRVA